MAEYVEVYCSGTIQNLPKVIWQKLEGPKPEDPASFINNGCTMSPDGIRGKRAWPACVLHDYHYNEGSLDRKEADSLFRRNLEFCLKADGMFWPLAKTFAFIYWRAVRRAGKAFYNAPGNPE